jgi:ATP-dependent helicase HrpB
VKPALVALPIDAELDRIVAELAGRPNLVVVAEPGAGKTTRVPPALLAQSFSGDREVIVLEPRRIAARMSARRVAEELGERVGGRVGYAVRFEREISEHTRLTFVTEALLVRRMLTDPRLTGVAAVVLDEFHERSLHTDLALALLRKLQRESRPDLRIVVMSATLDAERVASYLDAGVVRVGGRTFPVEIEHLERADERKLEEQVRGAVRKLLLSEPTGDVLVFLPGAAEIRRCEEAAAELVRHFDVELAMLHGDLPPKEQDRAISEGPRRKVIFSTNIAETSLTLPGVIGVVDSGLVRMAGHSPWSGLPTLSVQKVSQASATQRAGRAGRVRAGRCLRLYTRADYEARPRFDVAEVLKSDLCDTELFLRALFRRGSDELDWLDVPPAAARASARELLVRLTALDEAEAITPLGRRMLKAPVHPRAARLLFALDDAGYPDEAAALAALVSEREIRLSHRTQLGDRRGRFHEVGTSDLVARLEALEAVGPNPSADSLRRSELDGGAVRGVERLRGMLRRELARNPARPSEPFESAAGKAVLLAFPDRVARRKGKNSQDVLMCQGGSASLAEGSVVREAELLVAVEADERGRGGVSIRTASAIEPEWLLELFESRVRSETRVLFDEGRERVEASERMLYDQLVLDESRSKGLSNDSTARTLAEQALSRGPKAPWDVEAVERLSLRAAFAHATDARVPLLDEARIKLTLVELAAGKLSFDELRAEPLERALRDGLGADERRLLDTLAPASLRLPSGRELTIHYEHDRPPWVESRLQDFFGMTKGPMLGHGDVPLVLHLLAPNQRPVQVTTDLAGFWDRHYASVRRELMRRYPRHSWPEDPRTAAPPERRR